MSNSRAELALRRPKAEGDTMLPVPTQKHTLYRFAYYNLPRHKNEDALIHQLRDGDAALELVAYLLKLKTGYTYGGLLLNYPRSLLVDRSAVWPRKVDDTFINKGDLIVIAGRPPLSDHFPSKRRGKIPTFKHTKSRIQRSCTTLEEKVFRFFATYFDHCSRTEVRLNKSVILPPNHEDKRNMEFRQNLGATFIAHGREKKQHGVRRTALFLIHSSEAWPNGPGILCAFGMSGPETLQWSYLLRTRYTYLLDRTGFVLAEAPEFPALVPADDLSYVNACDIDIIVAPDAVPDVGVEHC